MITERNEKGQIVGVDNSDKKGIRYGDGLPSDLTDIEKMKVKEAYKMDCTIGEVCMHANISKSRLYRYFDDHPEFREECEVLSHKPVLKARITMFNNLDQPKWALKYLERKKKDEFSIRIEQTGANGQPLNSQPVSLIQNNLILTLQNAEPTTRLQFVQLVRKMLSVRDQGSRLSIQPLNADRGRIVSVEPQSDEARMEVG